MNMKVKIKTEFNDRYTGELHHVGEETVMSLERINEIMTVGNFIELVGQETEQPEQGEQSEHAEQTEPEQTETPDESEDLKNGEQQEEAADPESTVKRSTRRNRK
jgi:hypothetical protein